MKLFKTEEEKYGFKDDAGRTVIPAVYDFALPFSEGLAAVCSGGRMGYGKTGFINENGDTVIDFIYDGARSFSEGLAQVELKTGGVQKTGFIDHSGALVIPMNYNYAMSFRNGLAPVCIGESWVGGKFGCIDKTGREVIPVIYDYLEPLETPGHFKVKSGGSWSEIALTTQA